MLLDLKTELRMTNVYYEKRQLRQLSSVYANNKERQNGWEKRISCKNEKLVELKATRYG